MIAAFLRRLAAPAPDRPEDPDARLALAALLVQVARADGTYDAGEQAGIERILAARHGLTPAEAQELRRRAEQIEADSGDSHRFTRAIKTAVPLESRASVIESLWEVALADGSRSGDEERLLRLVSALLGVSDIDSGLARQRAQARLG